MQNHPTCSLCKDTGEQTIYSDAGHVIEVQKCKCKTKSIMEKGTPEHECNELGTVYEDRQGKRHYFIIDKDAIDFYNRNYTDILMGSVCCSICGISAYDKSWKNGK